MTRKNIRKPKDDPNACVNCGDKSDKKDMVPCAGCERKFHWFCNDPPMSKKPTKRSHPTGWFCKDCNEDGKKDDEEEELALTAEPAKKRKVLSDDMIIVLDDSEEEEEEEEYREESESEEDDDDQVPDSEDDD